MRTPDQEERADEATASEAFGDGFGSVEQGDLNDGYGTDDFYDETYSEPDDEIDADDTDDDADDDTFDDAPEDQGGFGQDETTTVPDEIDVDGDGSVAVPTGAEVDEDESGNILEEILDDVLGGDVDVSAEIGDAYGTDVPDLLTGLDDGVNDGFDDSVPGLGDDGGATSAINEGDGFDTPFDQPDVGDVADFVTESDFDLNADGHVDHGDLREAAHPFDFHADG